MTLRVTCAIIVSKGKVLCTQRGANMTLPLQWEFPGGKIEEGESPTECIVREIKEEINLDVDVKVQGPAVFHRYQANRLLELIPFVCVPMDDTLQLREHAQALWCDTAALHGLDWAKADLGILDWWVQNSENILAEIGGS
jgi:8-oxo-dGTP diphosphatase